MKIKIFYIGFILFIFLLFSGCFTQLDLVERTHKTNDYYVETYDSDSVIVDEYYYDSNYCYDPYYNFYVYWDPWWSYPRWGFYMGYYPWYSWYYYRYPNYRWWYYDYYSYGYWPVYRYGNSRNFHRRSFDRRSPYRTSDNFGRIVSRSANTELQNSRSRYVTRNTQNKNKSSVRYKRVKYRDRPSVRKPNLKRSKRNSDSRRPSISNRSYPRLRSAGRSGSSGSSRRSSGRSSSSSSRGSTRR